MKTLIYNLNNINIQELSNKYYSLDKVFPNFEGLIYINIENGYKLQQNINTKRLQNIEQVNNIKQIYETNKRIKKEIKNNKNLKCIPVDKTNILNNIIIVLKDEKIRLYNLSRQNYEYTQGPIELFNTVIEYINVGKLDINELIDYYQENQKDLELL